MTWDIFWSTFIAAFVGTGLAGVIAFMVYLIQRNDRKKEVKEDKAYLMILRISEESNILIRNIAEYQMVASLLFEQYNSIFNMTDLYSLSGKISRSITSLLVYEKIAESFFDVSDKNNKIKSLFDEASKEREGTPLLPLLEDHNATMSLYVKQLVGVEENIREGTFDNKNNELIKDTVIGYYAALNYYYLNKYSEMIDKN